MIFFFCVGLLVRPALSLEKGESAMLNLGQRPFAFFPPPHPAAITTEPRRNAGGDGPVMKSGEGDYSLYEPSVWPPVSVWSVCASSDAISVAHEDLCSQPDPALLTTLHSAEIFEGAASRKRAVTTGTLIDECTSKAEKADALEINALEPKAEAMNGQVELESKAEQPAFKRGKNADDVAISAASSVNFDSITSWEEVIKAADVAAKSFSVNGGAGEVLKDALRLRAIKCGYVHSFSFLFNWYFFIYAFNCRGTIEDRAKRLVAFNTGELKIVKKMKD